MSKLPRLYQPFLQPKAANCPPYFIRRRSGFPRHFPSASHQRRISFSEKPWSAVMTPLSPPKNRPSGTIYTRDRSARCLIARRSSPNPWRFFTPRPASICQKRGSVSTGSEQNDRGIDGGREPAGPTDLRGRVEMKGWDRTPGSRSR